MRDAIAETYPAIFADFNERIKNPAGFDRPCRRASACGRRQTGKANFIRRASLSEDPDLPHLREGVLTLITVRSNDQFNTTVYGYNDRLRGINGTRMVVLMNKRRHGRTAASRTATRSICSALRATMSSASSAACASSHMTCRAAAAPAIIRSAIRCCRLWHFAEGSKVPAAKSIPVRVMNSLMRAAL